MSTGLREERERARDARWNGKGMSGERALVPTARSTARQ